MQHARRFYDDVIAENPTMSVLEELEGKGDLIGLSMFNPKEWEVAQSWLMYQKLAKKHGRDPSTWSNAVRNELKEKVFKLQQYGYRSGFEKSIHFVMFPFSFQKKLYTGMGDWLINGQYRNLLLQEGLRRYQELSEKAGGDWVERYLPASRLLGQLNNFQFGLSPGRFVLEGMWEDNPIKEGPPRSLLSKAMETATAFFVPGGAATPLHQGVGEGVEGLKWLFVPTVLNADGAKKMLKAADKLFPILNDVFGVPYGTGIFQQLPAQATALTSNGAPYWQYRNYDAYLDYYNQTFEQMANEYGYSSKEGWFSSSEGQQFRGLYEGIVNQLGVEFPEGQQFASTIVDEARVNRSLIYDLIQRGEHTAAEEELLSLWELNELAKNAGRQLGISQDLVQAAISPGMRQVALANRDNREFARLWDKFLAEEYGPIEFPG